MKIFNKIMRRSFVLGLSSLSATLMFSSMINFSAAADEFPSKPIELVIHAKYGGGTDTTARMVSIRARRNLGTDISIVSKRGGSGAKAQNGTNTSRTGTALAENRSKHGGDSFGEDL